MRSQCFGRRAAPLTPEATNAAVRRGSRPILAQIVGGSDALCCDDDCVTSLLMARADWRSPTVGTTRVPCSRQLQQSCATPTITATTPASPPGGSLPGPSSVGSSPGPSPGCETTCADAFMKLNEGCVGTMKMVWTPARTEPASSSRLRRKEHVQKGLSGMRRTSKS